VNSNFMQDAIRQIYAVEPHVCYHGIDVDQFRPLGLAKRSFVLSVGSLTPLKGFDFLVQALSLLPEDRRPKLVIASNFQNPPERAYLDQLAVRLEVDLQVMGNVSDSQLVELYNRARVTLYAPVREPFGLVPLESMACETPVVAVSEGGIRETVQDGENGLLTERDPEAFASAVDKLVTNPELATRYGKNGRMYVMGKWSWERAVARLEGHLSTDFPTITPSPVAA
jgi:glycosyltransferase involved in cell wall biosynthesis